MILTKNLTCDFIIIKHINISYNNPFFYMQFFLCVLKSYTFSFYNNDNKKREKKKSLGSEIKKRKKKELIRLGTKFKNLKF